MKVRNLSLIPVDIPGNISGRCQEKVRISNVPWLQPAARKGDQPSWQQVASHRKRCLLVPAQNSKLGRSLQVAEALVSLHYLILKAGRTNQRGRRGMKSNSSSYYDPLKFWVRGSYFFSLKSVQTALMNYFREANVKKFLSYAFMVSRDILQMLSSCAFVKSALM